MKEEELANFLNDELAIQVPIFARMNEVKKMREKYGRYACGVRT